jgi:hypothetical protein
LICALLLPVLLVSADVAGAHGPCPQCIEPAAVAAGDVIKVDYPTVRAVLNPTRAELTRGPRPNCYGCQLGLWRDRVGGVGSMELGSWPKRRQTFELRVPDGVPSGRYLVALFDGSESGDHYTWDFIRVTEDPGGDDWLPWVAAAVAVALVAAAALVARSRRRA